MKFALHGMVTKHSNLMSDIRMAAAAGYEGLEIHTDKLWRYIETGGTSKEVAHALKAHNIVASAIDIIGGVEEQDAASVSALLRETETMVRFAHEIGAETIQLNAFEALKDRSVSENITLTAKNIKRIAGIGKAHGIRFQYEGAAWTPIHTLQDCLALVSEVGEDNFGLVIDFWHFWASQGATPKDIAGLPREIIFGVHCCGGIRPPVDENGTVVWVDESELRGYFPEEDINSATSSATNSAVGGSAHTLPVREWADAIIETGYDGWVSGEFLNPKLWEQDNESNAKKMKQCVSHYF